MHKLLHLTLTFTLYFVFVGYLDALIQATINQCEVGISKESTDVPKPLCSQYERPDKMSAVHQHRSRFNL